MASPKRLRFSRTPCAPRRSICFRRARGSPGRITAAVSPRKRRSTCGITTQGSTCAASAPAPKSVRSTTPRYRGTPRSRTIPVNCRAAPLWLRGRKTRSQRAKVRALPAGSSIIRATLAIEAASSGRKCCFASESNSAASFTALSASSAGEISALIG